MSPRFLSTTEAAEALGVSARRIRQLLDEGRVPGATKVGGTWLIPTTKEGAPKVTLHPPGRPQKEA